MQTVVSRIGIFGLGLIGGSIASALKKYVPGCSVYAYDSNEKALHFGIDNGIINYRCESLDNLANSVELLILATPVSSTLRALNSLRSFEKSLIVTDVCSVKQPLLDEAQSLPDRISFIGGHPMAGSEKRGVHYSSPDLFLNAPYVVCTSENSQDPAPLLSLIKGIGGKPVILPADLHDLLVSKVSHLPQIISTSLLYRLSLMEESERENALQIAGKGFKDVTRTGGSEYRVWGDILRYNKNHILDEINEMIRLLKEISFDIMENREGQLEDKFNNAKKTYKLMRGEQE